MTKEEREVLRNVAEHAGISYQGAVKRFKSGDRSKELWRSKHERTTSKKHTPQFRAEYNGREWSLREISEETGIALDTIYHRYNRGDRGKHLFRPLRTHTFKRLSDEL